MIKTRYYFVATLLLMMSGLAQAHQMNTAITKVLFNPRTHSVEIMHRFYLHDAEHALSELAGRQILLVEDALAREQFGHYVASHFAMGFGKPEPQALTDVGQEVDGKFIWVYQEVALPATVKELWFRFDALQEQWPEQVNQVNVEGLGAVKSLRFDRQSAWQSLQF